MGCFKYKVVADSSISDHDCKTLVNLYQPIVGAGTCAMYLTLLEENKVMKNLKNLTFDDKRLTAIMGISKETLDTFAKKLEGMNLLKRRYQKFNNVVEFVLLKPLLPQNFFSNLIFNTILRNKLGEDNYEIIKFSYQEEVYFQDHFDKDSDEETLITFEEAFPDEFKIIEEKTVKSYLDLLDNKVNISAVNANKINLMNIQTNLLKSGIPSTCLTKEIVKIILNNVDGVGISETKVTTLLQNSYDSNKHLIDENVFIVLLKRELIQLQNSANSREVLKIKEMESVDSIAYVEALLNKEPGFEVRKIIESLKHHYFMSTGQINCLLEYSVMKNDGKIVGNYLYKIAKTLNFKHIQSTKEVMHYLKQAARYGNNLDVIVDKETIIQPDTTYQWMVDQKNTKQNKSHEDLESQLVKIMGNVH